MKAFILAFALAILCSSSFAQYNDDYDDDGVKTPGDALRSATRTYYSGIVCQFVGGGMIAAGYLLTGIGEDSKKLMIYGGAALALIGTIINIGSFSYIGKAGRLMNEERDRQYRQKVSFRIEPTNYGVGIVCRF